MCTADTISRKHFQDKNIGKIRVKLKISVTEIGSVGQDF